MLSRFQVPVKMFKITEYDTQIIVSLNSILYGRRIVYNSCIGKYSYTEDRHFDSVSVSLHNKHGEKIK